VKKTFGNAKMTLLHIASVDSKSIEVLKYLIEQNADVHAKDGKNWTPIAYAAWAENHEAILYFLANGSLEPHKNCAEFPPDLKRRLIEIGAETGNPGVWRQAIAERTKEHEKAMIEIAKAKAGKDLQKYVVKKVK